jgi:archaellum component FlaC
MPKKILEFKEKTILINNLDELSKYIEKLKQKYSRVDNSINEIFLNGYLACLSDILKIIKK